MKQLKDYLSYYLGCEVYDSYSNEIGNLSGITYENCYVLFSIAHKREFSEVKPILRRLEDITDEEATKLDIMHQACLLNSNEYKVSDLVFSVEQFHYLLKQGFDLFNLIDENLAIDKKTLNG